MGKFKFGLCEWSVAQRGFDLCKLASESGLDGIQLCVGLEASEGKGLVDERLQKEYLEGRDEFKIDFTSISVTALDYFSMSKPENENEYNMAMSFVYQAIDIAAKFDIKMVMCPSFNKSAIVDQDSFSKTANNFNKFCQYAKKNNIMISTESNLPADDILKLINIVGEEQLFVYFDTQNHYLKNRSNMADLYRKLAPFICEIHVKDGVDDDLSGALLGKGSTGFYDTAEAILKSNYTGYIVLENYYHLPPLCCEDNSIILLKKDIETLKRVFN